MGKRTIFIFTLAYLLTLLITAPASLLDWVVQTSSQGRVLLANASGTIWNGSATPALRTQDGSLVTLPFLHWEIAVPSLLTGKIQARLIWDNQSSVSATDAIISLSQIELQHPQLQIPARVMAEASPMLRPAQFRGQLIIQGDRVVFSKRGMEGMAAVDWRQASSALSAIAPLGDYHLLLNGTGNIIHIGLTTNSGILVMEGDGNWQLGRGLAFQGKAHASTGNNDNLTDLLHNLGPEVSPGVHAFNVTPQ
jgi:general secretion pathway protein N